MVHPSFYLFYAYYKSIKVPEEVTEDDGTVQLGDDILADLVPMEDVPSWETNDHGNAFVHNLGVIKMNPLDWKRWFNGCFQTALWLGTSSQGRGAKERQNKGKGKGKVNEGKQNKGRRNKGWGST
jgi:hypothetical protein